MNFRDYDVEETAESVARALSGLEPWGSLREGADSRRSSASSPPEQASGVEAHDENRQA